MNENFEMVAKTMQGLEYVLAQELRDLGASNVEIGRRMVSFEGDKEMLYKANLCCRTALRILKPFFKFSAKDPDELYEHVKEFDWSKYLTVEKTFSIDSVTYSEEFTHSRFVTYRVKDAIVDWFKDKYGNDKRPGVRLQDADVMINVHISGTSVTLSLDSSGESLHKRGYRVAQTEAPINEVLAAGIILKSGWKGECPLVDPMCGSGTFLVEAALIAANINPGIYRKGFAFENWSDFDSELFDRLYNDDSNEREVKFKIYGSDISPRAIEIAEKNVKGAGVSKYVNLKVRPISQWEEAPQPAGVLITNPPYGERISAPDMEGLYETIGTKLKHVFKGYKAWIIGYHDEYFKKIGLAPSSKTPMLNGSLECELREYVIFEGDKKSFLQSGGKLKEKAAVEPKTPMRPRGSKPERRERGDRNDRFDRKPRFGGDRDGDRRFGGKRDSRFKEETKAPQEVSENPLALRRNENALKSIIDRKPTLPPAEGPFMRTRRGWRPGKNKEENKD
jgi:putative N6-adenine-specific DNA methylase